MQAHGGGGRAEVQHGAAGPGGAPVRRRQLHRDRQELRARLHRRHFQALVRSALPPLHRPDIYKYTTP